MVDRVRFLGFVAPVWGLLKTADVFVSISPFEGLPNAVLEAIACECPMVLSRIPAHLAMVEEANAYFVAATDETSVAAGLSAALAVPDDRKARAHRARAGARLLAPADVAREYDAVYRELLRH